MVMDEATRRFVLTEVAPGVTVDDVRARTTADFKVAPQVIAVRM